MIRRSFVCCLMILLCDAHARAADLLAGVARADLTPPVGGKMYGYGARGENVSMGIHDPLYAKAIVLSDGTTKLALVTLDLGSMPAENTAAIRKLVSDKSNIEYVIMVASHTHSAPTFAPDFPSSEQPYFRDVERKVADAIVGADAMLAPARIGAAWGQVKEGHNRRLINPDGTVTMLWGNRDRKPTEPVDHSLGVIALDTTDGQPVATLVNFACHPVILGPENLEISADWPGAMVAFLEDRVGGQAMFVQGAAGDINPFWDKTDPADGAFEQVEKMGEAVAEEAERVRDRIAAWQRHTSLSVIRHSVDLTLRWNLTGKDDRLSANPDFARILDYYLKGFEKEQHSELHTVLIGSDIALAAFPGEFFVEHGLTLKSSSVIPHTFFAGYSNGSVGYFPTIKAAAQGGYGATSATVVEVGTGEQLVDKALVSLHRQAGLLKALPD